MPLVVQFSPTDVPTLIYPERIVRASQWIQFRHLSLLQMGMHPDLVEVGNYSLPLNYVRPQMNLVFGSNFRQPIIARALREGIRYFRNQRKELLLGNASVRDATHLPVNESMPSTPASPRQPRAARLDPQLTYLALRPDGLPQVNSAGRLSSWMTTLYASAKSMVSMIAMPILNVWSADFKEDKPALSSKVLYDQEQPTAWPRFFATPPYTSKEGGRLASASKTEHVPWTHVPTTLSLDLPTLSLVSLVMEKYCKQPHYFKKADRYVALRDQEIKKWPIQLMSRSADVMGYEKFCELNRIAHAECSTHEKIAGFSAYPNFTKVYRASEDTIKASLELQALC